MSLVVHVRLCRCSLCRAHFVVENSEGHAVFEIVGPLCRCQNLCCRCDIEFTVLFNFFALLENYESVHTHQHMHPLTERNTEYLWDLQCLFKVIECRARKEKRGEEKSPLPKKIMASCVPEFNPQQFEVMEFRSQPACVVVGGC